MYLHIVRYITQLVVILMSQTAGRRNGRMYVFCSVDQAFIHGFQIVHFHSFHIGIYQNGSRVVTYHATTVARTCPFGEEAAFFICIDQSFLHFLVHRREHQVQEREQGTESIPETGIGKHITGQYFAIVRAVMNYIACCVDFIEFTREKQGAVHTGIERTILIQRTSFHLDLTQHVVPGLFAFCHQCFERIVTQFLHIYGSLVEADKGRGYFGMNDLAFLCLETDYGSHMLVGLFLCPFFQRVIGKSSFVSERFVKFYDEIVLEVFRNTSAILCRITDDLVFFRYHLNV